MQNHPLFNSDNDPERAKFDIEYINIRRFTGSGKSEMLTNQWDPEQLQTPLDVFNAVGQVEGRYELIGRNRQNRVVDRETITIKAPVGFQAPAAPEAPQPQTTPTAPSPHQAVPVMQAGGMLIPSTMDPNMAMMISMMTLQNQQMQAQMNAARQDSQAASQAMMQLFVATQNNSSSLMATAIQALAPLLAQRPATVAGGGAETENGFLKGIEVMAAIKEGIDGAGKPGSMTDWAAVSQNIVGGLKALSDITRNSGVIAGGNVPPVPPIPPGP
jgi:hypothetical protein